MEEKEIEANKSLSGTNSCINNKTDENELNKSASTSDDDGDDTDDGDGDDDSDAGDDNGNDGENSSNDDSPEPPITAVPESSASRNRGRPPLNKTKIIPDKNSNLKVGMVVQYKPKENDTWHIAKLMSRSGKCSGKYKNEWNTLTENQEQEVIDFDRQVSEWNEVIEDRYLTSEQI